MAVFAYSALNTGNTYLRGTISARGQKQAAQELAKQGLSVITIKQERKKTWLDRELAKGLGLQEKILVTRHLHTMLEAGLALDEALRTIAEQTPQTRVRAVLTDLQRRVQKGQPFHQALAQHSAYFTPLYINLVKVGETSGKLDEILAYLLEQQENDYRLRTRVFNAMLYPAIILMALVTMVSLMLVFVIPRIQTILESYNVELPLQTKILIWISYALSHYWYIIIPAVAGLVYLFRVIKRTQRGKHMWDDFILELPGIKSIVQEVNLARLTRTLTATLKSGLSIDQALALAQTVSTHSRYQEAVQRAISFVRRGVPLGEVLRGQPKLFPPIATRMIDVGEKTGKLDHMLERLAVFYETSVETKLTNLSSVIEPFMILIIGLVVGYVAISVMTPIWSFSQTV